jgi:RNA polymerase sigma factor (sigma-70 family)
VETVYAIDAQMADIIHEQDTEMFTSNEQEAAEETEVPSIINAAKESRDKDVLAAYLKELRASRLLTSSDELTLSRENIEQEYLRKELTGQLMLLVARQVSIRRLLAAPSDAHQTVRLCVTALSLQRKIKTLERAIQNSAPGSYEHRKLNSSRAKLMSEFSELVESADFDALKKRAILREIEPVRGVKLRQKSKVEKEFMHLVGQIEAAWARAQTARERLVKSNLRLVVGLARRYMNWGMPLADIIQEGNLGLMRAAEKFDYRHGSRFSTYASWWIRQAIVRCIDGQRSSIRLPVYMNERFKKMRKIARQFVRDTGAEPMPSSLADAMGLSLRHVDEMQQILQDTVSLETLAGKDEGSLKYFIVDPTAMSPLDEILKDQRLKTVDHALHMLALREQEIIRLRFGIGSESEHTLEEIGQIFNLSRERIRQLEDKALNKLKLSPTLKRCFGQFF